MTPFADAERRRWNRWTTVGSPATITVASPKSTSASAPGSWSPTMVTSLTPGPSSARRCRTTWRTVGSATSARCSSTRRSHTRRAVWRCLRGASRSARSHSRMVGSTGPSPATTAAARSAVVATPTPAPGGRPADGLRGVGRGHARTAPPPACHDGYARTAPPSTTSLPCVTEPSSVPSMGCWWVGGGARSTITSAPEWGQIRLSYPGRASSDHSTSRQTSSSWGTSLCGTSASCRHRADDRARPRSPGHPERPAHRTTGPR